MKRLRRKLARLAAVLLLLAAGIGLIWWQPAPLLLAHEAVWDRFVWLKPRPWRADMGVRIVDIDEQSLAEHGQWPWPRTRMARLVNRLAEYGARAVAFDVIFAEPDRGSLDQVFAALRQDVPGYLPPLSAAEIAAQPQNDLLLARALARVPTVLALTADKSAAGGAAPRRLEKLPEVAFESRRDQRYLIGFERAVSSLPALQRAAAANGGIDLLVDPDGISRRVPTLFKVGRRNVPSLALATVQVAEGGDIEALSRRPGLAAVRVGERLIPTDRYGQMRLYDSGSQPGRYVSAADVLDGSAPKPALDGAIVVIGTSAEGLHDLRLTPLDRWVPGMETHVQGIEQMLTGSFLRRPDWGHRAEALATLLVGLAMLLATWRVWHRLPPWSIALIAGLAFCAAAWFAFARHSLLLDPVPPAATLLAAAILERFLLVLDLRRERSAVRNAFAQYLSPVLVEELAADPDRLVLGGETRRMTFLFSDVRGFTSISEGFQDDPQGLTRLINAFLTPMTEVILARHGTIDKYMGDCIMAFWNAPVADAAHARHACDSALAMLEALAALNARLAAEAEAAGRPAKALAVGIGINTGPCVVGNMGSEQRFDYSVLGDAVNLASRLEGQSKTYGVGIVIGEETRAAVPDYAALELDLLAVKGKAEAARIFALLGGAGSASEPGLCQLAAKQQEMLAAYRGRDWDRAEALLGELRCREPRLATLCELYAARIAGHRRQPPGPDWAGVHAADSK